MSQTLKGLRVFVATPGGLEDERATFRGTLTDYNEDDAHARGLVFLPIGWELTKAGLGRPQEKINEDVRSCDYLVLVLGDRWGSPPNLSGPYTSGTEEEYNVARECVADEEAPMKDILVLFKGVDPKQLSDPGPQLERVLTFKRELERDKSLLFLTFDTTEEFVRHLRRQLQAWTREEEEGGERKLRSLPPSPIPNNLTPPSGTQGHVGDSVIDQVATETERAGLDSIEQADALISEGRYVEAESLYARAVVGRHDLKALTKYVRFLRRVGRFDQAMALSRRLEEMARADNDWKSRVEALSNLAIIARKFGDQEVSLSHLRSAVDLALEAGDEGLKDLAFLYDNIGLTQRKAGRFGEALKMHLKGIEVRSHIEDPRGMANARNHTGALLRQAGRLQEAEQFHRDSLATFEALRYPRGEAQALANLGEDLVAQGRIDEAVQSFHASLALNQSLSSAEGTGMNLWQLGRASLRRGDFDSARQFAVRAIVADDSSGRPEGVAGATHLLGQVDLAQGRLAEAVQSFESSEVSYASANLRLGQAFVLADLARVRLRLGEREAAESAFERGVQLGGRLGHAELDSNLEEVRRELTVQANDV